jgi:TPR repeat protein
MLELARRYRDGEGVPRNPSLAASWTAKAEDAGDDGDSGLSSSEPPDLFDEEFLRLMISTGVDVEELYRRLVESPETCKPLDHADLLTPEFFKAMMARNTGTGGAGDPEPPGGIRSRNANQPSRPSPAPQDPGEERPLERLLRLSGVDELEMRLALARCYAHGEGVQVDLDEAFRQIRLAAELGDEDSSLNAGVMLLTGTGTLSDIEAATPLLRRGLALSRPHTPFLLWIVSGQRPDLVSPDEGLGFLKRSADMGFPAAMAALASGPPSGDVKLLVQAARRGDLDSAYALADRYRQRPPEERDQDKAMNLYKQAAENGHLKSARTLERIHRLGVGTPADDREADKWRQLGDRIEVGMAKRRKSVREAPEKTPKKAAKKPAKQPAEKPAIKPAKKPLEKPAKKPKTASGKKPDEK